MQLNAEVWNGLSVPISATYAAFTLKDFDDQERNLTFVNTNFQLVILKFHARSFNQAFYSLHKL